MIKSKIRIGDQWITLSDLSTINTETVTDQEKKVIALCKAWLSNQSVFEFHTSGSTGIPKKITFARNQLIQSAKLTEQAIHLQKEFTSLVCLDATFIAGALMVIRSLVTEMNMIITSPSANPLINIDQPIDFVALVPYQLMTILEEDYKNLNSVKTIIIGGATLRYETIQSLQQFNTNFYATYGMTETITHIALQKLNGADRQDFFKVLPGIKISVDDRECLVIQADHLGKDPITTNDIVTLLDKDKFQWIGRYDQVINTGGVKVHPEKIERALEIVFHELNINHRFFVSGVSDTKLGEHVALVMEGPSPDQETTQKIKSTLELYLKRYEIPKSVLSIERFVETLTQKIDRIATINAIQHSK
ncbi:MAG: AMP-binding protein [Cyclobacteriaceae bacterium]|nr:AMP-binding protein [Cyclobacteriaceae bacterium]